MLCEKIKPIFIGEEQKPTKKKIFKSNPHFTNDNYFSGDSIMNYLGENGFSAVMTCCRYRLPPNIPPK